VVWTVRCSLRSSGLDSQVLLTVKWSGQSGAADGQVVWTVRWCLRSSGLDCQVLLTVKWSGQSSAACEQVVWTLRCSLRTSGLDSQVLLTVKWSRQSSAPCGQVFWTVKYSAWISSPCSISPKIIVSVISMNYNPFAFPWFISRSCFIIINNTKYRHYRI
jgi:hypothetical protein